MNEPMQPLRIHAPAAEPAGLLRERLDRYGAKAEAGSDGRWVVIVPLHAAPRTTVPTTLGTVRDWLEDCGLAATSVDLDGNTHLIRPVRARATAS